jgi:hypothetical protein
MTAGLTPYIFDPIHHGQVLKVICDNKDTGCGSKKEKGWYALDIFNKIRGNEDVDVISQFLGDYALYVIDAAVQIIHIVCFTGSL